MSKRSNRYTTEFKKQIIALIKSGKTARDITNEYGISRSTIYKWTTDYSSSGSFKAKDNRTDEERELIELRKTNKLLLMENDILKQAALIMGRK